MNVKSAGTRNAARLRGARYSLVCRLRAENEGPCKRFEAHAIRSEIDSKEGRCDTSVPLLETELGEGHTKFSSRLNFAHKCEFHTRESNKCCIIATSTKMTALLILTAWISGAGSPGQQSSELQFTEVSSGTQLTWTAEPGADEYEIEATPHFPVFGEPPQTSEGTKLTAIKPSCVIARASAYGDLNVTINAIKYDPIAKDASGQPVRLWTQNIAMAPYVFQGRIDGITGNGAILDRSGAWVFPASGGSNGTGCLVTVGVTGKPRVLVNFPPKEVGNSSQLWNPTSKVCVQFNGDVVGLCASGGAGESGGVFVWHRKSGAVSTAFEYFSRDEVVDIAQFDGRVLACVAKQYSPTSQTQDGYVAEVIPGSLNNLDHFKLLDLNADSGIGSRPQSMVFRGSTLRILCAQGGGQLGGVISSYDFNEGVLTFLQSQDIAGPFPNEGSEQSSVKLEDSVGELCGRWAVNLIAKSTGDSGVLQFGETLLPNSVVLKVAVSMSSSTQSYLFVDSASRLFSKMGDQLFAVPSQTNSPIVLARQGGSDVFFGDRFNSTGLGDRTEPPDPDGNTYYTIVFPGDVVFVGSNSGSQFFIHAPLGWASMQTSRSYYDIR